jgi:hypothetical protein
LVLLLRYWRQAIAFALLSFTIIILMQDGRQSMRSAAVVVDADVVQRLARAANKEERVVWERLHAMGAFGALHRIEDLGRYMEAGRVMRFSAAEIEKMRATGAARLDAPLSAGTLWLRDKILAERLRRASKAEGLEIKMDRYQDSYVAHLGTEESAHKLSVGYNPTLVREVAKHGLTPIFSVGSAADLVLAVAAADSSAIMLSHRYHPAPGGLEALRGLLAGKKSFVLFSEGVDGELDGRVRADFLSRVDGAYGRVGIAGSASAAMGVGGFIRQAQGRGRALILARLDVHADLEHNLSALRELLKELRTLGFSPELPAVYSEGGRVGGIAWYLRATLGLLIAILAPMISLRAGISVLRRMERNGKLPQAAPLREALAATGVTALTAVALGTAGYALLADPTWRLDATWLRWGGWLAVPTICLSFLALYAQDPAEWKIFFRKPLAQPSSLRTAVPVVVAMLLLFPPAAVEQWGPPAWFALISRAWAGGWWLSDRWRELLVGFPCLLVGLVVFFERLRQNNSPIVRDPRAWLLLAMFAPVGVTQWMAQARMPVFALMVQTLQVAIGGAVLGLGFLALHRLFAPAKKHTL